MPDSKFNKRIKNAELHYKRAVQRKLDPSTVADRKDELDALLLQKELNREAHDGKQL